MHDRAGSVRLDDARSATAILLTIAALGLCSGCKENGTGDNPPAATIPEPPLITDFATLHPTNVLAVTRVSATLPGIPFLLDATTGSAQFGTPGVDKGTVTATVESTVYVFTQTVQAGSVIYSYKPSQSFPQGIILHGGATGVTFEASDYDLNPRVVIVPGQLAITSPIRDATISRNQNLNVVWTVTGPGSEAAVYIADGLGHARFYQNLGNVSSFTIPVADMQTLNAGTAYLYAISYNYQLANANDGVLIGEATFLRTITLQ